MCSSDGSVNCLDVSGLRRQSDAESPSEALNEEELSGERRISVEIGEVCCCPPCEIDLCRSLPNVPALVRAEPLNDGRRVVVQDFVGNVDIWDVVEVRVCGMNARIYQGLKVTYAAYSKPAFKSSG